MACGFLGVILVGSLLLSLPPMHVGEGLNYIEALFTATSAVCVTGLVVVDTGTFFSPLGQGVIMALIFIGSLGFMTMTTLIFIFLGRRITLRDRLLLGYCVLIVCLIIGFFATAVFASLVKVWPYNLELGFWHYNFEGTGGGGYEAFFNSVRMSFYTAIIGTAVTFFSAYLTEKTRNMHASRQAAYFLSIIPLALPGMVIGLSYIFFFNAPGWTIAGTFIPNPFNALYGTMAILVLCNIVHFYTVSFLTATTALKQMDKEFESVAESMAVPFYKTFFRVTVPVCLPAILEIGIYFFVNAMATVSGVIFLYSSDTRLASVAIANMDDAGDIAPACAMAVLVVLTNVLVRVLYGGLTMGLRRRAQTWMGGREMDA